MSSRWTGNLGSGTSAYTAYSRAHECTGEARALPSRLERPRVSRRPGALQSRGTPGSGGFYCHMLWVLHLCADAGIVVTEYTDEAWGEMVEHARRLRRNDARGAAASPANRRHGASPGGGGRFTIVRTPCAAWRAACGSRFEHEAVGVRSARVRESRAATISSFPARRAQDRSPVRQHWGSDGPASAPTGGRTRADALLSPRSGAGKRARRPCAVGYYLSLGRLARVDQWSRLK